MGEEIIIKALTLHQPWASLVAGGYKKIETRSWRPPAKVVGSRIAIQAGKKQVAVTGPLAVAVSSCLGHDWRSNLVFGAVIATVRVVDVRPTTDPDNPWLIAAAQESPVSFEAAFGDYSAGRWAWQLDDVEVLIEPIFSRGYQGLWSFQQNLGAVARNNNG